MHAYWRGALLAALLMLANAPAADVSAQTPAADAPRPSFRDMRRLEPASPPATALPAVPPSAPPAAAAKALPSATPFGQNVPAPDKGPADKAAVEKASTEKSSAGKFGPDKPVAPVKANAAQPVPASLKHLAPGACGMPAVTHNALSAGRMQVLVASACRAREAVIWRYGGVERQAVLDSDGRLELMVEGFAATSTPLEIVLADKSRVELPFTGENLGGVTKVALVWRGPAALQLHAFEHAAVPGKAGHVWSGAASSAVDAARIAGQGPRGAGFLSVAAGGPQGDHVEVYTFVHASREAPGHIAFAVRRGAVAAKPADAKAEPEAPEVAKPDTPVAATPVCNPAALAEVAFRLIVAVPGQPPVTSRGIVAAADCGAAPHAATTFETALLPALRLGSR